MIAKICSDMNKPDGQTYVDPSYDTVIKFMDDLTIRKIPYIGGMRETTLQAMGFLTGKDLRERATELMVAFTPNEHKFLIRCGMGLGQTKHGEEGTIESFTQRGCGISETFRPRSTKEQFREKIAQLSKELSKRMIKE